MGWKDPYAKGEFSARQRKLTQLQRSALVYTPQVLLQGRDFRRWGSSAFDEAVARINAQAAKARIALEIRSVGRQAWKSKRVRNCLTAAKRTMRRFTWRLMRTS